MKVKCSGDECDAEVDPTATGVYREVTGWEKIRAKGGLHALVDRKPTGRVLCPICSVYLRYPERKNQGTLF